MNISVITKSGEAKPIIDHTEGNFLGYNFEAKGVFVEDALTPMDWEGKPYVNTCIGVQNLIMNQELRKAFHESLAFENTASVSTLFSLFNGTEFSDFIEVSFSDRFMNNEVGPKLGFMTGVALKVDGDPYEAIPQLSRVKKALTDLGYKGEVALGVSERFTLTGIHFGHLYGHFAMYAEICQNSVQDMLDYMFGECPKIELYDSLAVGNVISQPPFPSIVNNTNGQIRADRGAEKHLWRVILGGMVEIVLHTVHGTYMGEARKRLRRTIEKMLSYSDILQYRTDFGYGGKFILCKEKYERLLISPHKKEG